MDITNMMNNVYCFSASLARPLAQKNTQQSVEQLSVKDFAELVSCGHLVFGSGNKAVTFIFSPSLKARAIVFDPPCEADLCSEQVVQKLLEDLTYEERAYLSYNGELILEEKGIRIIVESE